MSDSITVDAARLPLLLGELRLPTVAKLWQTFTERADREGWPSARLLATLAERSSDRATQRNGPWACPFSPSAKRTQSGGLPSSPEPFLASIVQER